MPDIFELSKQKLLNNQSHTQFDDEVEQQEKSVFQSNETSIIVCGNQNCGKTTLICRFMEKQIENSKTIGLDYNYLTRMKNNNKMVCSLWEIGGGVKMAKLVKTPLTSSTIETAAVFIFVDLSTPNSIIEVLSTTIQALDEQITTILKEINSSDPARYEKLEAKKRLFASHKDSHVISCLGIPSFLVLSRYDQFQNYETEKKKHLYRLLRFFAHINGLTIVTFGPTAEGLVSKCKALLSNYGFYDSKPSLQQETDVMKPLIVVAGMDSLESIGHLPGIVNMPKNYRDAMIQWKETIEEQFPPEDKLKKKSVNVTDKQFAEYEIDANVEEKKRELELFIQEKRNRRMLNEKSNKKF